MLAGAEEGISQEELTERIQDALPDDVEAVTGEQAAAELSSDVQEGFAFFSTIILVFGVIALLVGIFVIYNTFSIIVQQRTRELALLRAVGASRRQVLLGGDRRGRRRRPGRRAPRAGRRHPARPGLHLARSVTTSRPASPSPSRPPSARCSIGVVVTLVAAVIPAVRATRVPPLAAMRDVAIDRSERVEAPHRDRPRSSALLGRVPAGAGVDRRRHLGGAAPGVPGRGAARVVAAIIVGPVLAGPSVRIAGARRVDRQRASPGSWRWRTPPAARSAPRPPRPRSSSASAWWPSCSVFARVRQGLDRQGDLARVRRRLRGA